MAYLSTLYLAAESLGKLLDILDDTGILIGCGLTLNVILKLLCQLGRGSVALSKNDSCLYYLTSYGVGSTCDCGLDNSRVCKECALYLKGSYTVA